MSLLLRFLGISAEGTAKDEQSDSLTRIAAELDDLDPKRARLFACFAFVLNRVASADLKTENQELAVMQDVLVRCTGISSEEAQIVVRIAAEEVDHQGGTQNYTVTREFGRMSTPEERVQLLECLYAVAAADDLITGDESTEITLIAQEIGLSHQDMLAIRSRFRDKLAEMRKLPGEGGRRT